MLLAAAAGLLLPGLMAPAPKAIPPAGADAAASKPAEPPDPILSPEAKAAARLEAQQGLAKVLTTLGQLSARQPQSWDAAGWAAAQRQLADGERAYREERYPAAIRLYRETGRQLATLEAALPGLIASRLRAAQHAFDTGRLQEGYDPMSMMPWTARKLLWNPEPMGRVFGQICLEAFARQPQDFGRTVMALLERDYGRAPLQQALTAPVEGRPALATAVR